MKWTGSKSYSIKNKQIKTVTRLDIAVTIIMQQASTSAFPRKQGHAGGSGKKSVLLAGKD
jgi:hypothetical protein